MGPFGLTGLPLVVTLVAFADEHHSDKLDAELRTMAQERSKETLERLLDHLSDLGFSWRDIARVVGVSVPALRKWRLGGPSTGENRRQVSTLVALCDIARSRFHLPEIAAWLETPVHPAAPLTGLDMMAGGRDWPATTLRPGSATGPRPRIRPRNGARRIRARLARPLRVSSRGVHCAGRNPRSALRGPPELREQVVPGHPRVPGRGRAPVPRFASSCYLRELTLLPTGGTPPHCCGGAGADGFGAYALLRQRDPRWRPSQRPSSARAITVLSVLWSPSEPHEC